MPTMVAIRAAGDAVPDEGPFLGGPLPLPAVVADWAAGGPVPGGGPFPSPEATGGPAGLEDAGEEVAVGFWGPAPVLGRLARARPSPTRKPERELAGLWILVRVGVGVSVMPSDGVRSCVCMRAHGWLHVWYRWLKLSRSGCLEGHPLAGLP